MSLIGVPRRRLVTALRSVPGFRIRPQQDFWSDHYIRHTQRRLEHLATLGLDLQGRTVLETGAGIGDHTSFFIDRGCQVTITDGRQENLSVIRRRFPDADVRQLDLDSPEDSGLKGSWAIVYCYGTLYHLRKPTDAIRFMSERCDELLLLETCVSYGEEETVNRVHERAYAPSQAISGEGCRPTRAWVFNELKKHLPFVYATTTQPWHSEFPLDWTTNRPSQGLVRAIFVGSKKALDNPLLAEHLPLRQRRA